MKLSEALKLWTWFFWFNSFFLYIKPYFSDHLDCGDEYRHTHKKHGKYPWSQKCMDFSLTCYQLNWWIHQNLPILCTHSLCELRSRILLTVTKFLAKTGKYIAIFGSPAVVVVEMQKLNLFLQKFMRNNFKHREKKIKT